MKKLEKKRTLVFQICILLYLITNIITAKHYGERIGQTEIFGKVHYVYREWGVLIRMIGYSLIPTMVAWILEEWKQKQWKLVRISAGVLRITLGAMGMVVAAVMLGIVILGKKDISMINGVTYMALFAMMIVYAILEWVTERKRVKKREKKIEKALWELEESFCLE